MKPEILNEKPLITLYNADCLDILPTLGEKSVDLILTDPPYGLNFEYENLKDTQENLKQLINKFMPEALRVAKRVVLTCGHTNIWHYPPAKWIMAWIYGTTNQRNSWGFTSWQPILCYGKDPYLENGMGARMDIIKDSHIPATWIKHPCPKSEPFIEIVFFVSSK